MNPQRYRQVDDAFDKLLELPTAARQQALAELYKDDEELRCELIELLRALDDGEEFLRTPFAHGVPFAETAPVRAGAYRLNEFLGEGGSGKVYRADSPTGGPQVALKLNRAGRSLAQNRRFRQEWQLLVQLDHPSIARCYDYGVTAEGQLYLVTELVENAVFIDRWCDENCLTVHKRLALFSAVCRAVATAHQAGVVHRDIKPQNILVSRGGVPKLIDFGIAKLLDPGRLALGPQPSTASSIRLLSPGYTSPEQLNGCRITPASDVYALGVLLFELLTGCSPYRLEDSMPSVLAISRAVCEKPLLSLSEGLKRQAGDRTRVLQLCRARRVDGLDALRRQFDGDLEAIVGKALSREPGERYATAHELEADLRRWQTGRPVLAGAGFLRRLLVQIS